MDASCSLCKRKSTAYYSKLTPTAAFAIRCRQYSHQGQEFATDLLSHSITRASQHRIADGQPAGGVILACCTVERVMEANARPSTLISIGAS
jgi:hypothetical protein